MVEKIELADKFETNIQFVTKSRLKSLAIVALMVLMFFALVSGVSAKSFNSTSNVNDIQDFLSNASETDNELVLDSGEYNSLSNLNVSRGINIRSNGQVNIQGTGGTLFNIISRDVKIVNLNISGYETAIRSNAGGLSVIGCNISTSDRNIDLTGPGLTDVLLENNTIISSVSNYNYGAVSVNADSGSVVSVALNGNNILANGATDSYGVRFNVPYCDNTLTFTNNNITGTSRYGAGLSASSSNNTALSFIGNNITGNDYAMYIYSYQQLSGLSLLNNIFVSSDIGLFFALDGATLSDILITGNTINATNTCIGFEEYNPSSVGLTVNYNRILADVGLNFTTTDAGSNFDYNWWGINDITDKVVGFDTNNHYILNITNLTSLDNVRVGDKVNFALLVLNTTLTNDGVENLPYFVITGLFNGVSYSSDRDDRFVHQFTIPSEGLQTIDASLDEEYVALEFNASKRNSSSTIVVPDDVRVGKTINITGVVTDNDGNPVANLDVSVTVDGKTYSVTTDSNGRWTLVYKPTHTGNVDVSVSWEGNNIYNGFTNNTSFNVKKGNIIVTITVTENDDGSVTIVANATDEDGDPVSDHSVDFVLDGETVGHEVTDSNGIATITIPASKLSNGTHIITVIVGGGDNFNDGIASIEFTVTKQNNDTNDTNDTNETSNNSATAGAAAMKETGMPMVVFLILAVLGFATYRRKW